MFDSSVGVLNLKKSTSLFSFLSVYGITHALVDATCAAIVFSLASKNTNLGITFVTAAIIYNILAFGTQFIFGLLSDKFHQPLFVAILGTLLVALAAVVFNFFPITAIILAGLGNSLFHVGGGSISLNLKPGWALAPGIFVAPGAIGLVGGMLIGKYNLFPTELFALILFFSAAIIYFLGRPVIDFTKSKIKIEKNYFIFVLLLILFSVLVRSTVGLGVPFPWKTQIVLLILSALFAALGKGLGGFLADKFGWLKISLLGLIVSIPLLLLGKELAILGILGMFFFQMTMPVTLVAVALMLPGRPGLAFGLPCLALLIGAVPIFNPNLKAAVGSGCFLILLIGLSVVSLFLGIKMFLKKYNLKR